MTPAAAIAALDNRLAQDGEDIILQRVVGAANQATFGAKCRAFVRGYQPHQLIGTIIQGDSHVILSPTDINRSGWPGAQVAKPSTANMDARIPLTTDKLVQFGKTRSIQAATPFYIDGELVRIELQVRG